MRLRPPRYREALTWLLYGGLCVLGSLGIHAQAPLDRVAAYGQVSPGERAVSLAVPSYLGAPQSIAELLVKEGDHVTRNQKLAVTNNRSLAAADVAAAKARQKVAEERLNAAKAGPKSADVAAQEALIKSLEADARAEKGKKRSDTDAKSREVLARQESLDWKVTMAQRQLEAMSEQRPTDIAVAQAEFAEAAAAVARAEVLLLSTEIVSPGDGQVLKILSHPGEGAAGQGLLEFGETQSMLIKAELNVADVARVKPGAKVAAKSDAWRGEIAGTVARVSPRVERSLLSPPSTFSNVDRIVVEATITPEKPEQLAAFSGAEVTVLITAEAPAK